MPGLCRLGDSIQGSAGEHSGHVPPHGLVTITGNISGNCSPNVNINGQPAATEGSVTTENDSCCGTSSGSCTTTSTTVFINGKGITRIGDPVNTHAGSGSTTTGSDNVLS